MDWAASSVAGLCLAERRASDATMLCRSGYRPRARLHATAAALAARIECAPVGSHTIDGTRRSAAALKRTTIVHAVQRHDDESLLELPWSCSLWRSAAMPLLRRLLCLRSDLWSLLDLRFFFFLR